VEINMEKELYIARDDYSLILCENKPYLLCNDLWLADGEVSVKLNPNWFPEITKENSPKKIKLIIE
jgi:hypothetical protein